MKQSLEILLYPEDATVEVPDSNLTDIVQNLRFGTKLHGGFSTCSFQLRLDMTQAWEYITTKIFYRLTIRDTKDLIWEGRLQDIGFSIGAVDVVAYGYYASLNDGKYSTAYNDNADVVIKAILTAQCPDISSDQTHIDATGGPAISSGAAADYLDKSPRELVERLAAFGDTDGNTWFFAIWDNRIPYFFERDVTAVKWYVNIRDLARFKLVHRGSNLWNKVYAIYTASSVLTRTADASDATSQNKYGVTRYYTIPNLGEVVAAAAAAARDTWLADHKDLYPDLEDVTLGEFVLDANGIKYPSSRVRAGDIIRIRDLVPLSDTSVARDALRTFYVMETTYDAERRENRLTLDKASNRLDSLLARKL